MAINRTGVALTFYAMYVNSTDLDGETGLTVTVDVYEGVTQAPIVTAGSASELAGGVYYYTLASGSVDAEGAYICMFKTASGDVVQKWIPALWSVWTAGAPVQAVDVATDALDAAAVNADAVTKIQAGLSTLAAGAEMDLVDAPNPTAVAAISDAAWDEALAGHAVAGSTGKALADAGAAGNPWEAAVRTLTQTAQQIAAAISGSTITVHRGDLFNQQLVDLGAIPADRKAFWLTVKVDPEDEADSAAILQIKEGVGLMILNGAASTAPTEASLTVDNETDGDVTPMIKGATTAQLGATQGVHYDFQYLDVDGQPHTLAEGTFVVNVDVTRATS